MKKIMLLVVALSFVASSALAASYSPPTAASSTYTGADNGLEWGSPQFSFKSSKNVNIVYIRGSASGSGYLTYSCGSYHSSGTKSFGSSTGDTKIFSNNATGAQVPGAPATASASADFSSWTAL